MPSKDLENYLGGLREELNKILIRTKEVEDILLKRKLDELARRESIREMELLKTSRSV